MYRILFPNIFNKFSFELCIFTEVEKEYEETERRLMQLSEELVSLNCEMMIHLQVTSQKN